MKIVLKIILFLFVVGIYVNIVVAIIPNEAASGIFGLGGVGLISYLFFRKKKIVKKVAPPKPTVYEPPFKVFDILLTGYSFESVKNNQPRQVIISDLQEFDHVILEREPLNKEDSNAVLVLDEYTKIDIGYISSKENKQISQFINKGYTYSAHIKKIFKDSKNEKIPIIIIEFFKPK